MSWRRVLHSWLPVFAVLLLAANARAQLPPESLLAAAATTLRDESGSAWVLAAWQPTSGNVLTGRTLAVYLKSGTPGMPGPWRRMGLVGPAPATSAEVQPLLQRGVALGDSEVALANTLAALIDLPEVRNADGTADRLATALGLAATRPEVRSTLELLSSRFISVASALGRNWAAQVPVGPVTIEVRDHDVVTAADRFVVARLSVNVGFPPLCPPRSRR